MFVFLQLLFFFQECMPISSPPMSYNLERPGCSGISVGPEIGKEFNFYF